MSGKKILLVINIIISLFLISACDMESDSDTNSNNIHGNQNGNINGNTNDNTNGNTNGGINSTKSKISLQCNNEYYINTPFTINVITEDNRPIQSLSWNQNTESNNVAISTANNSATITANTLGKVSINVIEDGTNYESDCSFNIVAKTNKPLPPSTPQKTLIKLQCNEEYLEDSTFNLSIITDDDRYIHKTIWTKNNNNIELMSDNYDPARARVKALSKGKVTIYVKEFETNYTDECTFTVKEEQPQIYLENYDYSFIGGETKVIKYAIIPKKFSQEVEIKQPLPEGYSFKVRHGEIEVTAHNKQGSGNIVLVSKSLQLESHPINLTSSSDYNFSLDKSQTGVTEYKDNKAHSFTVRVNKSSEFTSYKLYKENFPLWLHVSEPKKISALVDEYTFSLDENKRVRHHNYEIVFLPGNSNNIQDKKAQKIRVSQDRNYAPEKRTIKFFKGAKEHTAKDFLEEWDYSKEHYTTGKVPEYYLYENGFEGWYNSNKIIGREASRPQPHQDTNICWAYAATNGLHWWLEHNKEEVERYMNYKKPKETDVDNYNKGFYNTNYIPSKNLDPKTFSDKANMVARENKSDIAKTFRKVFYENKGGFPNEAILWYLAGKEYVDYNHPNKAGFGLVKDIFPTVNVSDLVVRKSLNDMTQDKLNNLFENAIENDRIFLLTIRYNNGALHAVNVWGYVVDEFGDVCEIYIGDNNLPSSQDSDPRNDRDLENTPVYNKPSDSYLLKYGIDIKNNGDMYLMNLTGKRHTGALMNLFYELDLGKKYFEAYFKKMEGK